MTKNSLAIVIPAYKIDFFEQTIASIANQTCLKFTLYIGDDASSHNFYEIVSLYKDKINIQYKRFDKNLGAIDLVAHWNRCIDMVRDESWIWLFSDDDFMDKNCVEMFYTYINNNNVSLLHFNINIVDENNSKIYGKFPFKSQLSMMDFFKGRLNNNIKSCVVEYIFNKKQFEEVNRFESFDLGWGSDDATWLKLSKDNGITTIDGACVHWRQSSQNISPKSDSTTVIRKLNASLNYLNWVRYYFAQNNIHDLSTDMEKASYIIRTICYTSSFSYKKKYDLINLFSNKLQMKNMHFQLIVYWLRIEAKEKIKKIINYDQIIKKNLNK